jgi:hypothetical protein
VHPFHAYLCEHLDGLLRKCSVIVFYEPRNEFGPFFALRAAVEPIVAADKPEPLILYLPSVTRDRTGSVLMELEKAGTCYEPQLKRFALNVLRRCYTDGQIDEMLRPASVTYEDIVAFLGDGDGGNALSVLDTLFGGAQGEALVTQWAGLRCEGRSTWNTEKTLLPFQNGVLNLATLNLAQYSPAMGFNVQQCDSFVFQGLVMVAGNQPVIPVDIDSAINRRRDETHFGLGRAHLVRPRIGGPIRGLLWARVKRTLQPEPSSNRSLHRRGLYWWPRRWSTSRSLDGSSGR